MPAARPFAGFGTVVNAAAVIVGSLAGLAAGRALPPKVADAAVFGVGLITLCLGVQMFLRTRNPLVVVSAVCVGGALGAALGLDAGMERLAEWARVGLGGHGTFNQGFVTASVLFCIGPMTLMGCLQDALEGHIELLGLKSLLDGISSVFLAATLGVGVLVSAVFVLVFQGLLTLAARKLARLAEDDGLVGESVAVGGVLMVAIGLGITGIKSMPSVLFLPALVCAPVFAWVARRLIPAKTGGDGGTIA
ncbi:MAG: DUF554 domain-containing protein [Armatimonadetes bacterium]|nr:DUF554 domain-containing protein [Armatimonadota bacterium]MBS1710936.1 DUF554 domain-containing protein [Armatimonadota bacterium]MBX3108608.1 DUF554 domain-containing protein [Fimbriimonadaceae bacterium]